ncbi:MAG: hypothetical protein ACRED1_10180, partial [Limisphaerales bacterium]
MSLKTRSTSPPPSSRAARRRCRAFVTANACFTFALVLSVSLARADGLAWPGRQMLPTFSKPAAVLDCIDVSASSGAEIDLFASLEGIVNRARPRIICVSDEDGEGKFTWVRLH